MITIDPDQYDLVFDDQFAPDDLFVKDHLGGFDSSLNNEILERLNQKQIRHQCEYHLNSELKSKYPHTRWCMDGQTTPAWDPQWNAFEKYTTHPVNNLKNFMCCFNGTDHVSRQLLVSILHKFGLFNVNTCTKNFTTTKNQIDGFINNDVHRKFFTSDENFLSKIYSIDDHKKYHLHHANNIKILEQPLTESFVQMISETMATSYYPFITEKFLYSVCTRGLFVAYAQPKWHEFISTVFGFKLFDIFDYSFDSIQDPVQRLIKLIEMIGKFAHLSKSDWSDLYEMEVDKINYNHDHYHSKKFFECMKS